MKIKSALKRTKYLAIYCVLRMFFAILKILGQKNSCKLIQIICRFIGPKLKVSDYARENIAKHLLIKNSNNDKLLLDIWLNVGQFIHEFIYLDQLTEDKLNQQVEFKNLEILKNQNQPFIIFSGHFANWELILNALASKIENLALIYRQNSNPLIHKFLQQRRSRKLVNFISSKGLTSRKELMNSIKARHNIITLIDQRSPSGQLVPLFGELALTNIAIAKIALKFDYKIIPAQMIRQADGNFKVIFSSPLEINNTLDDDEQYYKLMCQINLKLEAWIKNNPSQWLWWLSDRWNITF